MTGQPSSGRGPGTATRVEWPSTAQRALENLRVNTPGLPSIGHEVMTMSKEPGSTQQGLLAGPQQRVRTQEQSFAPVRPLLAGGRAAARATPRQLRG